MASVTDGSLSPCSQVLLGHFLTGQVSSKSKRCLFQLDPVYKIEKSPHSSPLCLSLSSLRHSPPLYISRTMQPKRRPGWSRRFDLWRQPGKSPHLPIRLTATHGKHPVQMSINQSQESEYYMILPSAECSKAQAKMNNKSKNKRNRKKKKEKKEWQQQQQQKKAATVAAAEAAQFSDWH